MNAARRVFGPAVFLAFIGCVTACRDFSFGRSERSNGRRNDDSEETSNKLAVYAQPSLRCGECHESIYEEWRTSAHARATSSPLYKAMAREQGDGSTCTGCHAPLSRKLPAGDPLLTEGVSCDGCHTVPSVRIEAHRSSFDVRLEDNIKYGPRCDASDHYFHRMGCAPLYGGSQYCAACHWYERSTQTGLIPVFTEYKEWLDGPYAAEGTDCQSCHMPPLAMEAATGAGQRPNVGHHGFLGRRGDLRSSALTLSALVHRAGAVIRVEAHVRNEKGGHYIPTGLPGRQVVLRARVLSPTGSELEASERVYSRRLTDARDQEAPFYRATRVASDTRIPPRGDKQETFELRAAEGELVIDVRWRNTSPALATQLSLAEATEDVLLEARMPLTSHDSSHGHRRPASLTGRPPARSQ